MGVDGYRCPYNGCYCRFKHFGIFFFWPVEEEEKAHELLWRTARPKKGGGSQGQNRHTAAKTKKRKMDAKNKIYKGGEGIYSAALELDALIRSSSQRGGGGSGRRPITKLKIDSHNDDDHGVLFSYFFILIEKKEKE